MKRREFIALLGGAAAWPVKAHAQSSNRIRRVGILMPYPQGDSEYEGRVLAFRHELARLGWVEGETIRFDERWTTDNMEKVRAEATDMLGSNPDVVLANGGRVIPVLLQTSRSVPIVVPGAADPVGVGWVQTLARPGGNITGFTFLELSIFGKMLDVLKRIAPSTVRVANFHNPDNPSTATFSREFERAAGALALEVVSIPIHDARDIERATAQLAEGTNSAIFFPPDLTIQALREKVVPLVARHRLPAIYADDIFVRLGGLASYSTDRTDLFRRAASYVDRILRGEQPGELPFQQPTKYQLKINLKTARSLGLEPSPALLATADEVSE